MSYPFYVSDGASGLPWASRKREDMHPVLRERFERLEAKWAAKYRFRKLFVTCSYRNVAEQTRLWRLGRTMPGARVTDCDGLVKKSLHNVYPSLALDVAVSLWTAEPSVVKPTVTWNAAFYRPLLWLSADVGLVAGGGWTKPDWPHLELPKEAAA